MDIVKEFVMSDYISHWVDKIDATFFKEAIRASQDYRIPEYQFPYYIDQYIKGKWWVLTHQN